MGDDGPRTDDAYDLCIVGAGPAGLSASLEAKRLGLTFVTIDQAEEIGGTVARYPRAKLVTTQPIELPLYGRLRRTSYEKEELVELWNEVAREQELPVHGGLVFQGVDRDGEHLVVDTSGGPIRARHVCLALGRRGAPRKLGVPGEELGKVSYALLDARSYAGRRALVVGGGDSAVEAALALGEQAGAEVTLSYRREAFFRIKALNERRLDEAVRAGRVRLALGTEVTAIEPDAVRLRSAAGAEIRVANDAVFALIGGIAPTEVLRASGVSFDPGLRDTGPLAEEAGTGLVKALAWALALTICVLAFAAWNLDYYGLSRAERPAHEKHDLLRPGKGLGLWLGIASIGLVAANLLYLVRRSPRVVARLAGLPIGSLKGWMTSHVATGVLAFLLALLHAAMAPRNTVGSHALWALLALLVTGAIGRYFYAWLPRAANGEELDLDGVKRRLDALAGDWDREHRAFGAEAQARVLERVRTRQWGTGFFGRVVGLVRGDEERKELVVELRASGAAQGLSPDQVAGVVALAEQAWRSASRAAHLEDARALLGTWRYLHRWIAALMVALAVLHIGHVLFYGGLFSGSSDDLRQLTRAAEVTR
ncbi:MAG: NAD(P)-binding domain-containing protein [Planctomycetota bacterium]